MSSRSIPSVGLVLPVTAAAAGSLGLAYALAQLGVGIKRSKTGVLAGADLDTELYNLTRAAGTIGEYAPVGLILLSLLEKNRVATTDRIELWAGLFVALRLAHSLQLSFPKNIPIAVRGISFYSTIALLASGSVALLVAHRRK